MKPLFWDEEPASKPVVRATYFLQKGNGWLPYGEKDSELLEVCLFSSSPYCLSGQLQYVCPVRLAGV